MENTKHKWCTEKTKVIIDKQKSSAVTTDDDSITNQLSYR